jgi:hypothetical protein
MKIPPHLRYAVTVLVPILLLIYAGIREGGGVGRITIMAGVICALIIIIDVLEVKERNKNDL